MRIDRKTLQALRPEIEAALLALGQKHGLQFKLGNGHYGPEGTYGDYKLELATLGENGVAESAERVAFRSYASLYGLKETDLDTKFQAGGQWYKITGLKTGRSKKNICLTRFSDNAPVVATAEMVRQALGYREPFAMSTEGR